MLHIRLLGTFLVITHNQPVVGLTRAQLKTLLAYLVLRRSTPPMRDELIWLLWHEKADSQSRSNLRNLLHHLKQVLPAVEDHLASGDDPLAWKSTAIVRFDVMDFEAALQQAAQCTDSTQEQAALRQAVEFYTGDLWPECREEWIIPERERLRNLYIGALEQLSDLLEAQRDYVGALQIAQRLLQYTPLREESYRRMMHLYACLADRAGVERTFHECETQLATKLHVTPSVPTCELYERLTRTTVTGESSPACPFVERRKEWVDFQRSWEGALGGTPHCLLLTGAAGIGKTRLLTEMVASVERHGQVALVAQCHPFTLEVAYAPLSDWLRTPVLQRRIRALSPARRAELAYLLPDDYPEQTTRFTVAQTLESWQRQRLYETLMYLFLAQREPLLLVIDNAQWCDQGTIDWLHYLLSTAPTAKLLVVGALSSLELRPHYPVALLWPRLQQSQLVTEIRLPPLTAAGVTSLGSALAGAPLTTTTSEQLYAASEGNPLYVVEALRAVLAGAYLLSQVEAFDELLLQSPLVQATLQLYFASLSTLACDILGLAATIGHTFSFELLMLAALSDRATVWLALDELLQRHVMRDYGENMYTFTHHLLQRAAYIALSSAKRQLWHERVMQARQQLDP